MGEDRLLALAERRPWAMSGDELMAALDEAHALRLEVEAVTLRLIRQIEKVKSASALAASSAAVWYRNRHRISIRSAHRWVKVAKRVDAAPAVVGDGVASGAVNLDQADVVTRALATRLSMCAAWRWPARTCPTTGVTGRRCSWASTSRS